MPHARRGLQAVLLASVVLSLLLASTVARAAPHIVNGPYLTGLTDTRVEVRFELDADAPAAVQIVREGSARPAKLESREVASMHVVPAPGLEPSTRYKYDVFVGKLALGEGHFTTAPRPDSGSPLTFLVYGDGRTDAAAHGSVVRAMGQVPADFLVNTGDLVERGGSPSDWEGFFDTDEALLRDHALFATIGNHELAGDAAGTHFLRYFGFAGPAGVPRVYGTTRFGNIRFFFLDGRHDWGGGEERQWLDGELARADTEADLAWRVAVLHDGPWSAGPHGPNTSLLTARVPELLVAHKVDLLFSGHDHLYERGDAGGMKYIVTGGAGAPLYEVVRDVPSIRKATASYHFVEVKTRPESLEIVAWRPDGTAIDRCAMPRGGGPWDCDPPPAPAVAPSAPAAPPDKPRQASCGGCSLAGAPGGDVLPVGTFGALVLGLATAGRLAMRRDRRG